jgi:putative Mn2+ efflux pump MntP
MLMALALVLPLSLDSFGAAAALAGRIPARKDQRRVGALFALCEATIPLVGVALGAALATAVAGIAGYAAIAIVAALGVATLLGIEPQSDLAVGRIGIPTMLVVGIAISIDELAIGASGALTHVPLLPLIALIAAQALLAPQLGFRLGSRILGARQESVERAAGFALLALAAMLALEQLHVV